MASNPMGPMSGDPGDENDSKWQQCEQDIEDLESRVAAIEQKMGVGSPTDEQEMSGPMSPPAPGLRASKPSGGKMPFIGSLK